MADGTGGRVWLSGDLLIRAAAASLAILLQASVICVSSTVSATRTWPAPPAPKLSPGMVTTFSSASSFRAKSSPRESGLAHIDHDEHAAFGHAGGNVLGAFQSGNQGAGAALVALLHGVHFGEVIGKREGCGILEEGLRAEEHGFGERQGGFA